MRAHTHTGNTWRHVDLALLSVFVKLIFQRIKNWILFVNVLGGILYIILLLSCFSIFFHLFKDSHYFHVLYWYKAKRTTNPIILDRVCSDQEIHPLCTCQMSSCNSENTTSSEKRESWAEVQHPVVFREIHKPSLKIAFLHPHVNEHVLLLITLIFHNYSKAMERSHSIDLQPGIKLFIF